MVRALSIKIIPNFLKEETFNELSNILLNNSFPWFYSDISGGPGDYSNFFFQHWFYLEGRQNSEWFGKVAIPILGSLDFKSLIRVKANCYSQRDKEIITRFHIDDTNPHTVALYSLNTNNGYTLFENGEKVHSVANQMAIFDGRLKHASVSQTDTAIRVNVNFNLIL
tara:strand:+ start:2457 stop:2957 length:501 start_codon:yes stop_codon:yes gene_type:complete